MDAILKKIEQAKDKSYRGEPVGIHVSIRVPPLLLEGAIAHMNANGLTSLSAAIIDILEEGIVTIGTS
jgi:hypothetical protein